MPLLREEAEKLSNNELEQGVIETLTLKKLWHGRPRARSQDRETDVDRKKQERQNMDRSIITREK
ncbi:hypothetical protein J4V13_24445, partial [Escherichia coli]